MQVRGASVLFPLHNFRLDYSGLEPKIKKDDSSVDISELPSKGDRFESLH